MWSRDLPRLWQPLLFPAPCPLIMPLSPFGLALLLRVHPPLAISRQQKHALWLNTGFFKSLTIFIPIFLGVFFHAALPVISSTGKQGTQGTCLRLPHAHVKPHLSAVTLSWTTITFQSKNRFIFNLIRNNTLQYIVSHMEPG